MNPCLRSMALAVTLSVATSSLASLLVGAAAPTNGSMSAPAAGGVAAFAAVAAGDTDKVGEVQQTWICDRADNICGLDDPRMLSKPAKVDYDALLKATPEMKKIVNDKIDPNSSEGINLRQRAVDRVRDKSEAVRTAQGYCSVWKTIRHQDGRTIPDVTDLVKAQL